MAFEEHVERIKAGVDKWNHWRERDPWIQPDLWGAYVRDLDLQAINLKHAKLTNAVFTNNNLGYADLSGADLSSADLRGCNLQSAKLTNAILHGANLSRTYLKDCDMTGAQMEATVISDLNLAQVKGVELVTHRFKSEISTSALEITATSLSNDLANLGAVESFLRGAGVTDEYIEVFRSRIGLKANFYSCFISYSSNDRDFAERLFSDLQSRGVRCWYAPEHLRIGRRIRDGIDDSILRHDKLLLVLSESSVASQWVEAEVATALRKERELGWEVLFPLRLDDSIITSKAGWVTLIQNTRNIGNFCDWRNHDTYIKSLERLLRDLRMDGTGRPI